MCYCKNKKTWFLLIIVSVILSSCGIVSFTAKSTLIEERCLCDAIQQMIDCSENRFHYNYPFFFLSSKSGRMADTFSLQSTTFKEMFLKSKEEALFVENINGKNVFFTAELKNISYNILSDNKFIQLKSDFKKLEKYVKDDAFTFDDGVEEIEWLFINNGKYQVIDVENCWLQLNDWLHFAKDTSCIDNPLYYDVEVIELESSELDSIIIR